MVLAWKQYVRGIWPNVLAALAWIAYEIVANARANLQAQRITAGFGFLANNAGFDVSQSLIPYSGSDPYTRVFVVGLLNTLLVSVIGIFFATIIGFLVALGRLSPNWLLSRISGGYVELIRNTPFIVQLFFIFFGLPAMGLKLSETTAAFLAEQGARAATHELQVTPLAERWVP